MASRVQGPVYGTSANSPVSCTFTNTPAIGNVIVAVISCSDFSNFPSVSSISQSGVNWSNAPAGKIAGPSQYNDGSSDLLDAEIWLGIVTGSANKTLSVSINGSTGEGIVVQACEYTDVLTSGTITDGVNTYGGKSSAAKTNSVTTANANDLLIGVWCCYENTVQSSSYMISDQNTHGLVGYYIVGYMSERIVTSTGTYNLNATSGTNVACAGCIVALKGVPATVYTQTEQISTDLKKLALTKTDSTNVLLKKLELPTTYNFNANFLLLLTRTYNNNVLIKKFGVTTTYGMDTILGLIPILGNTYQLSVRIWQLHQWSFFGMNTLFKKHGVAYPYSINFIIHPLPFPYSLSAKFTGRAYSPVPTSVLFKKHGAHQTEGVDCVLVKQSPPPVYAMATLMIQNPNGTLWVYPKSWEETQKCTPAIRPIPLAESEYLDAGSYTLEPKQVKAIFRLSDDEKDLFEQIYGYASTDQSSNYYTNFYLQFNYVSNNHVQSITGHPSQSQPPQYQWYLSGWIREKDYKYEWVEQSGRYVRMWTVTATLDIELYNGSSANVPNHSSNPFDANAVTLNGLNLVHILNFDREDTHPPMIPKWVNQPAEVDSYLWSECVLDITYEGRFSNDEKYIMEQTLQAHSKVSLADFIHNVVGNVWVSEFEARYEAENWIKPWRYTIRIQANNSEINFTGQGSILVNSWGVNSSGSHIGPDDLGTLYLDEGTTPLPFSSGCGSPISLDLGIHVFYFFLPSNNPNVKGFYGWNITGDACVVQKEGTYDIHTFDGESRVTILVWGPATIIPEYIATGGGGGC